MACGGGRGKGFDSIRKEEVVGLDRLSQLILQECGHAAFQSDARDQQRGGGGGLYLDYRPSRHSIGLQICLYIVMVSLTTGTHQRICISAALHEWQTSHMVDSCFIHILDLVLSSGKE